MVCLRYFFNEAKSLHWMRSIESRLSRAGRIESLEVALALVVLLLLQIWIPPANRGELLIAGVIGLVLQIVCTSLAEAFGSEEEAVGRAAAGGGIASLIYLEQADDLEQLQGLAQDSAALLGLGRRANRKGVFKRARSWARVSP
jgi:hypothetical protein